MVHLRRQLGSAFISVVSSMLPSNDKYNSTSDGHISGFQPDLHILPTSASCVPGPIRLWFVCWLVGCLTSQQQASVSQGRICSDNFTCCHTEIEVADPTFYLTQSQYTDTGPTSPSADPRTPALGRVATGVPMFKSLV